MTPSKHQGVYVPSFDDYGTITRVDQLSRTAFVELDANPDIHHYMFQWSDLHHYQDTTPPDHKTDGEPITAPIENAYGERVEWVSQYGHPYDACSCLDPSSHT